MTIRRPKISGDGLCSADRALLTNELLIELIEEVKSIKATFTPDNIILPEPKIELVKPEPKLEKVIEIPKLEIPKPEAKKVSKPKKKRGKKNDK